MEDSRTELYLKRHLSTVDNALQANQEMMEPLGIIEFHQEGDIEITQGDLAINFSYGKVNNPNLSQQSNNYLESYFRSTDEFRELKKFQLTNTKTGKKINLDGILPPGTQIIFDPQPYNPGNNISAIFFPDNNEIILPQPITTVYGIVTLFHEIGHLVDLQGKSEKDLIELDRIYSKIFNKQGFSKQEAKKLVETERKASSFALDMLRPFTNTNSFLSGSSLKILVHLGLNQHTKFVAENLQTTDMGVGI